MNNITIHGRLVRDVKTFDTKNGKILVFDLVCNNKNDNTIFIKVVKFVKDDVLVQYLKKGKELVIFGSLEDDSYTKDGKEFKGLKIIASEIVFVG